MSTVKRMFAAAATRIEFKQDTLMGYDGGGIYHPYILREGGVWLVERRRVRTGELQILLHDKRWADSVGSDTRRRFHSRTADKAFKALAASMTLFYYRRPPSRLRKWWWRMQSRLARRRRQNLPD